jgi:hypothetical protein
MYFCLCFVGFVKKKTFDFSSIVWSEGNVYVGKLITEQSFRSWRGLVVVYQKSAHLGHQETRVGSMQKFLNKLWCLLGVCRQGGLG